VLFRTKLNAKKLSERFRDRLVSPIDTAVYWIEHIGKNRGGQHMRSLAIDMPFYQYFLLDVIAFYFFILISLGYVLCKGFAVLRRLCSRKQKEKSS